MNESQVRQYWEERLSAGPTLENVGWLGWGAGFNRWMYRIRAHVFVKRVRAALKKQGIIADRLSVLDVGCGSGFYIDLWKRTGVRNICACDLTSAVVDTLSKRYPDVSFARADVGEPIVPYAAESFDAISCMDVLFHIVDDNRYRQAVGHCAHLLKPGGLLILTENCLHSPTVRSARQVSRSLPEVADAISAAGLSIIERRPMFVLMNTPIDSKNAALNRFWALLRAFARRNRHFGFLAGMALYPLDLALTSFFREGPSTEMLICRRDALQA